MAAVIIGLVMWVTMPGDRSENSFSTGGWDTTQESSGTSTYDADDTFVRINGGSFLMGSQESENWRIDDEMQHEVTVASFYIDPFETTQEDYERLMGVNPSTFTGEKLPVENILWLDAVQYSNKKSETAGLTPAYTITNENVSWDRSANGYRLPTEAE